MNPNPFFSDMLPSTSTSLALLALFIFTLAFPRLRSFLFRIGPTLLIFGVCFVWWQALVNIAKQQPPGIALERVTVRKSADRVSLGSTALVQNPELSGSASEPHVGFRNDGTGNWIVANLSTTRNLLLRYVESNAAERSVSFNADRFFLRDGDLIEASTTDETSQIVQVGLAGSLLKLTYGRDLYEVRFDGAAATKNAVPLERCTEPQINTYITWLGNQFGKREEQTTIARLGGSRSCYSEAGLVLSIKGLPFAAARVNFIPGIGAALVTSGRSAINVKRGAAVLPLTAIEHATTIATDDGKTLQLESFIAGFTRYRVGWGDSLDTSIAFSVVPMESSQRITGYRGSCNVASGNIVEVVCREIAPYAQHINGSPPGKTADLLPSAAKETALVFFFASAVFLFICKYLTRISHPRKFNHVLAGALSSQDYPSNSKVNGIRILAASAGVAIVVYALNFYLVSVPLDSLGPQSPLIALLSWSAVAPTLLLARGAKPFDVWLFLVWTILVALGHIALFALSLANEETRFLRFANDASFGVMVTAGVFLAFFQITPQAFAWAMRSIALKSMKSSISDGRINHLVRSIPRGFWAIIVMILGLAIAWAVLGTETGIAGYLQPSEAMKVLFILALAVMLSLALNDVNEKWLQNNISVKSFTSNYAFYSAIFSLGIYLIFTILTTVDWRTVTVVSIAVLFILLVVKSVAWRSFAAIGVLLGLIASAPVIKSDLSPALIIFLTTLAMTSMVVIVHTASRYSDSWLIWGVQHRGSVRNTLRIAAPRQSYNFVVSRYIKRQTRRGLPALLHPVPWLFALPIVLITIGAYYGRNAINDVVNERISVLESFGGSYDIPLKRYISWLEFNGQIPEGKQHFEIEFADTALQVDLSRKAIAKAPCLRWPAALGGSGSAGLEHERGLTITIAVNLGRNLRDIYLNSRCGNKSDTSAAIDIAMQIPAIQSDFVGTWLTAFYGRDGAVIIAFVQILLFVMILISAFQIMRWTPGQTLMRPAAATAAYAVVGFAIILALQWLISWSNALGVVPVMGQPSTFLSHGRSHFVFFGMPAMLFVFSALRMRSAFQRGRIIRRNGDLRVIPAIPLRESVNSIHEHIKSYLRYI